MGVSIATFRTNQGRPMMRWREPGYPGDECPGKQGYPGDECPGPPNTHAHNLRHQCVFHLFPEFQVFLSLKIYK